MKTMNDLYEKRLQSQILDTMQGGGLWNKIITGIIGTGAAIELGGYIVEGVKKIGEAIDNTGIGINVVSGLAAIATRKE